MPDGPSDDSSQFISDLRLIIAIKQLRALRAYMRRVGARGNSDTQALLAGLYQLKYRTDGRPATPEEWEQAERITDQYYGALTESQLQRFLRGEIPPWISGVSTVLAGGALIALVGAKSSFTLAPELLFFCYLIWLTALGAIGSVASIGMNALSVQHDITFDLNNERLMVLRISLGALFGLVLTLPFGFDSFYNFIKYLNEFGAAGSPAVQAKLEETSARAMALLMPFVLGFSTSLVIMVLNRFVDGVQAFFGKQLTTYPTTSSSPYRPYLGYGSAGRSSGYNLTTARPASNPSSQPAPATPNQPSPAGDSSQRHADETPLAGDKGKGA